MDCIVNSRILCDAAEEGSILPAHHYEPERYATLQPRHETYKIEDTNILIGLASRFYSLDNLQSTIVPERALAIHQKSEINFLNMSRIQDIETSTFRLSVFQTITGLRFLLITDADIQA